MCVKVKYVKRKLWSAEPILDNVPNERRGSKIDFRGLAGILS